MERVRQKLRTRRALLEAARQLITEGCTPTVAEAAERAEISRATAYRYFATQDALLAEAPLDLAVPTVEELFDSTAPGSAVEKASMVRAALYEFSVQNEHRYRLFLRNWHDRALRQEPDQESEQRGARRVTLLEKAFEELAKTADPVVLRRLIVALSVLVGVESMLVQRDVLDLPRAEAEEAFDWAVRVLVEAVEQQ